jgi:hypothetical protein
MAILLVFIFICLNYNVVKIRNKIAANNEADLISDLVCAFPESESVAGLADYFSISAKFYVKTESFR